MTDQPFIRIRGLQKSYGDLHVLRGLDLDLGKGEVVSIVGPSGSGKSTLLRVLMTLETPDAGEIELEGEKYISIDPTTKANRVPERDMRAIRMKVGMVFQHFNLFPHMSALRNVTEAPIRVLGMPRAEAEALGVQQLESVGLGDKLDARPVQLSGGQKQRVAIARALAMKPKIMLFDEITSALDPELVGGILDLLRRLAEKGETTMLIVTHHMNFARESADRALFFDGGEILEDSLPEDLFSNPQHPRTKEFLAAVLGD